MTKLAIITGASAGIGKATATWCIDHGFDVINLARRDCPLPTVTNIAADLSVPLPAETIETLKAAVKSATTVAIVHSAGQHNGDDAMSIEREALERSLAINVTAPATLNAALLPTLPSGSSIVFVGSTLGDKAVPGALGYVASKHAVNGLMRATCQDTAGRGIHTAVVSPGFTDTEMLRSHLGDNPDVLKAIVSGVTHGRLINVEEIAATIGFCIENPVINGAVIHANLGQIER
ncbi:MAG: SDR family oxidoreductase [Pseudomonadota bacterium]